MAADISLTKKVKYHANERLDLNDKLAEDTLQDETLQEVDKGTIGIEPDGRVFFGWRTTTTPAPNGGFTIAAEDACAMTRDGKVLLRDGAGTLTTALTTNAINYIHAYYDETDSDVDSRRTYTSPSGPEVSANLATRITRTADLYVTTTAYGAGTPSFSNFDDEENIGGTVRQLLPLYAVAVDAGDTITSVTDYRPMFAFGTEGGKSNEYENSVADLPHNFSPTDVAGMDITSVRQGLVALADRLKQTKQTAHWWDDSFGDVILADDIFKTTNNSVLRIAGGNAVSAGANIELYGGTHATLANQAYYDAVKHIWRNETEATEYMRMESTGFLGIGESVPATRLHIKGADTGARFRLEDTAAGDTALTNTMPGVELVTTAMDTTNKYTAALKFMSADPQLTTQNPKFLAAIVGRATEAYDGDTKGGMAIDFCTTPNTQGASSTPTVRMTIDQSGYVGIDDDQPDVDFSIGGLIKARIGYANRVTALSLSTFDVGGVSITGSDPTITMNAYIGSGGWRYMDNTKPAFYLAHEIGAAQDFVLRSVVAGLPEPFGGAWVERMRVINGVGPLGVSFGATTPVADVFTIRHGNSTVASTGVNGLFVENGQTTDATDVFRVATLGAGTAFRVDGLGYNYMSGKLGVGAGLTSANLNNVHAAYFYTATGDTTPFVRFARFALSYVDVIGNAAGIYFTYKGTQGDFYIGPDAGTHNASLILQTEADNRVVLGDSGKFFTGTGLAVNVDDTNLDPGGICINHGAGNLAGLTLKNSDVSHSYTGIESDTYFYVSKAWNDRGGAQISTFADSSGAGTGYESMRLFASAQAFDTTKTTTSLGTVTINANFNGAPATANSNIFVTNNDGSARMILNAEGDLFLHRNLRVGGSVGLGAMTASVALEIAGTTGALLLPRLTSGQRNLLTPTTGMMIYNVSNGQPEWYMSAGVGGVAWKQILTAGWVAAP